MTRKTTAELDLVIACCRWPRSAARDEAIREAAAQVTDWERFERVVARHRVLPLARDGLSCAAIALPPMIDERLSSRAARHAIDSLAMARESFRLQRAFRAAGLAALIIKGSSVGQLAYGDVGMKESWDIDLLTTPEDTSQAHSLLQEHGYGLEEPSGLTAAQFARFRRYAIEAVYRNSKTGLVVELHWRATQNRRLLPEIDARSASQSVVFAGQRLLTLGDDTLFAYLCVHGTRHGWVRLKWLADVNALIADCTPREIERRYRSAVEGGAGRAPAVTLLLCKRLLGARIPSDLMSELEGDRFTRILEATAIALIRGRWEPAGGSGLPPLRWVVSKFLVAPGAPYLREEVRTLWDRPIDRARFGAPMYGLAFHLLRIPLMLGQLLRRSSSHLDSKVRATQS